MGASSMRPSASQWVELMRLVTSTVLICPGLRGRAVKCRAGRCGWRRHGRPGHLVYRLAGSDIGLNTHRPGHPARTGVGRIFGGQVVTAKGVIGGRRSAGSWGAPPLWLLRHVSADTWLPWVTPACRKATAGLRAGRVSPPARRDLALLSRRAAA